MCKRSHLWAEGRVSGAGARSRSVVPAAAIGALGRLPVLGRGYCSCVRGTVRLVRAGKLRQMSAASNSSDGGIPSLVDGAHVRDQPQTRRGVRTRQALVDAARTVFERDGFLSARLVDITAEAQCSVGTFYTYFEGKDEVFAAVLQAAQDDMMHPGLPHVVDTPGNIIELMRTSNVAYMEAYKRNAKLMLLLEQVASIDPAFRELRLRRAEAFTERFAKRIADLQAQGYADPELEPTMTARGLSSIISRLAYLSLALELGWDTDVVVDTVTGMWVKVLGIPADGMPRTE